MNDAIQKRLQDSKNIWLASARTDGRPHLVPVWFAWHASKLYLCIEPESVKGRNIARNHNVALALEDGKHPVICEGTAPWNRPGRKKLRKSLTKNTIGISPRMSSTLNCWKSNRENGFPGNQAG